MITDTGWLNPQTIISNGAYTGTPWNNPNNLLFKDGQYASTGSVSTLGSDVVLGNYLFNIPQGSLIVGIEIQVTGYRGVSASPATTLELYGFDNTNGNNFFYPLTPFFSNFTTSPVTYFFGSSSFLFNTTWTVDQINNFKVRVQANGQLFLDDVQVKITYSPSVTPAPPVTIGICDIILQAQPFNLVAPVSANPLEVNWLLDKFKTSDGVDITNADITGRGIPITIDQGNSNEENAYVTFITSTSGDQRIITVTRGWSMRDPVAQSGPWHQHGAGAEVIIGNSVEFYDQFLRRCHIGSLVSAPIAWYDEGSLITDYIRSINAVGAGVFSTGVTDPDGGKHITFTVPGFTTNPPTVINVTNFNSGGNQVTTFQVTGFLVTGTDRFLLAEISIESTQTVTDVQWNSVSGVFQGARNEGDARVEVWTFTAPNLGTHNLDITLSGPSYLAGNLLLTNSTDQVTPWSAGSTNGSNTNLSTGSALTTTQNAIVVHALATKLVGINYTAGGGESLISKSLTGAVQGGIEIQYVGSIASVVSNVALSQATDWANLLGSINGVTPVSPGSILLQTNGVNNGDQTLLNLVQGAGILITDDGFGNITITNTGGGGGGGGVVIDQLPLGTASTYGSLTGAINGINTTFVVSSAVYLTGKLVVFKNLIQQQGSASEWVETNPATGTFDFITPPMVGDIITVIYQTTATTPTDELVKVSAADTTAGYLQPKLNVHSSDSSVTVTPTITNPGANEILDIDLTGAGGGSSVINVTQFEDFIARAAAGSGVAFTYAKADPASFLNLDCTSELNHPGIVTFDEDGNGVNLQAFNLETLTGGIPTSNDFEVEILTRCVYNVNVSQHQARYEVNPSADVLVVVDAATAVNAITYDIFGTTGTTTIPVSGTWFKIKFIYTAGTLEFYVDNILIDSVVGAFSGPAGWLDFEVRENGGGSMDCSVDYVKLNYQVTR